jgi:hypothetical protein
MAFIAHVSFSRAGAASGSTSRLGSRYLVRDNGFSRIRHAVLARSAIAEYTRCYPTHPD